MNALKRQFKDFWLYFRLTRKGANLSDSYLLRYYGIPVVGLIIGCVLIAIQFVFNKSEIYISVDASVMFIPFIAIAAVFCGALTAKRPSLLSVAPFSSKQRIVFSFLSAFLHALIIFVVFIVIYVVCIFIIACLFSIAAGEFLFVAESNDGSGSINVSTYEQMFLLLLCVIYAFSYFAISFIDSFKYRNIVSIVFVAVVFGLSLAVTNICGNAMQNGEQGARAFFFGVDLTAGFAALKYAWIIILIECAMAVCAVAASIILARKRFKQTDY